MRRFKGKLKKMIFILGNCASTGILIGPINFYWYQYLDTKWPGKAFRTILKKIILDQLICATVCTFLFIMIICFLEGMTLNDSLSEFANKFPYIYLVGLEIFKSQKLLVFLNN
jgi:protein Mpv17